MAAAVVVLCVWGMPACHTGWILQHARAAAPPKVVRHAWCASVRAHIALCTTIAHIYDSDGCREVVGVTMALHIDVGV